MAQEPKTPPIRIKEPELPPIRRATPEPGVEEGGWEPAWTLGSAASGALMGARAGPYGALAGAVAGGLGDFAGQMARNSAQGLPWWVGLPFELIASIKAGKLGGRLFTPRPTPTPAPTPAPPTPDPIPGIQPRVRVSPTATEWHQPPHPLQEAVESTIPAGPRRVFQVGPGGQLVETSPRVPGVTANIVKGQWPTRTKEGEWIWGSTPLSLKKQDIPLRAQSSVEGSWPNVRSGQPITAESLADRLLREQRLRVPGAAAKATDDVLGRATPVAATPKATKVTGKSVDPPEPPAGAPSAKEIADTAIAAPKGSVWRDVTEWGRERLQGAGQTASYLASPILSAIERTAGPIIGKQITAMEGAKSARQAQIWTNLFGDLVESLHRIPKSMHQNFVDSLEGRATAQTPVVASAVTDFRRVFGNEGIALVAQQQAGLKVKALDNYFMHEFEPAFVRGIVNNPERKRKVIEDMVSSGVALNQAEARVMLKQYLTNPQRSVFRDFRTGAEYKRTKNYQDYIIDPVRAVSLRGRNIAQRLAELEVYGAKKVNIRELIKDLEPEAIARTLRLVKLTQKRDPVEQGINALFQSAMTFNAATSLSLAYMMNMSQPTLLALRTSLPTMAKGIFTFMANPVQSWKAARELGIYADMAQRVLMQESVGGVGGKITNWALRGFNLSEKFVRAIAAEAGKDWARTIQQRLRGQIDDVLTRELNNLNFTAPEVQRLVTTRTLTPNDVKLIQWSIADQVSFLPRTARKSEFYLTTPIGPVILQFKNFLMNTGRLLKQSLLDELRAGNKEPILKAIGTVVPMALIGEVFADLNAAARGSKRPAVSLREPSTLAWRALDNVTQIGALGLGMGLIQEMTGLRSDAWRSDLARFAVGPTVTAMGEELQHPVQAARALVRGDKPGFDRHFYESLRRGIRRVPYGGPWVANQVIPSTTRPAVERNYGLLDRLGFSRRALQEEKLRDLRSRLKSIQNQ